MYIRESVSNYSLARHEGWDERVVDGMDLVKELD